MEAVLVRERRREKSVLEGRRDIRGAALTTARPANNRRVSGESAPKREPRREPRLSLAVQTARWQCETRVFVFENRIVSC